VRDLVPVKPPQAALLRYQELAAELGRAVAERDAAITRARHSWRLAAHSAQRATEAAQQAYQTALETASAAAQAVERTDAEARRLWRDLGSLLGRPARLGPIPEPVHVAQARPTDASTLLRHAEHLLARARRGELSTTPPLPTSTMMLLAGAIGALVLFLTARSLLALESAAQADSEPAVVLRAVALLLLFIAPVAGVPLAAFWLSWRYRKRAGPGNLALCALAGIVVLTLLGLIVGLRNGP